MKRTALLERLEGRTMMAADILTEGLNNTAGSLTLSGGSFFSGTTSGNQRPASSPLAAEGTHSWGRSNGTATLTSNSIDTTNYENVSLSFRLASISGTTGNGADTTDTVLVEVSTDGGSTWLATLQVAGNSNARWGFNTGTGTASTAFDGDSSPVSLAPASGGDRTADGFSTITVTDLPQSSDLRFRIAMRNNSNDEIWLVDDLRVSGDLLQNTVDPPVVSPASGATVDSPFVLTFTDAPAWRSAITAISVDGIALPSNAYSVNASGIGLFPDQSVLLQSAGVKNLVITATGFSPATVSQDIGFGLASGFGIITQPGTPSVNGGLLSAQPVVQVQDQYGNTVATNNSAVTAFAGAGDWFIGGTTTVQAVGGIATFTDLTAASDAAVTGATMWFIDGNVPTGISSPFDIPAFAAPTAPTFANVGAFAFDVSWQNNPSATGYRLDIASDAAFTQLLPAYTDLAVVGASQNVTGLSPGTTYYARVRAVRDTTISANSATGVQATTAIGAPVATSATNVGPVSFVANWRAVQGASGYQIDVFENSRVFMNGLIFSEYVEGSSSNKYIEIFNGTGADVDLSDYRVELYSNGSSSVGNSQLLSGLSGGPATLADGSTLVLRNSSAALTLPAGVAAFDSGVVNFNGDDALALVQISTGNFVDIFGRIGQDPGAAWTAAGGFSTLDRTLRRRPDVLTGVDVNPTTTFATLATQWESFASDAADGLGSHTFNSGGQTPVPGFDNLAVNGTSVLVTGLAPSTDYAYVVRSTTAVSTSVNSNLIAITTSDRAIVTDFTLDSEIRRQATLSGSWQRSSSVPGFNGANYIYTNDANATATFAPPLEVSGQYEVFWMYSSHPNRASNAVVSVNHARGTSTTIANQKSGGGVFRSLGTFDFAAGSSGSLVVQRAGADGIVTADAVRFVRVGDAVAAPPTASLSLPGPADSLTFVELNEVGFLDVTFASLSGLDTDSIIDAAPEFTLSGPGTGSGVTVAGEGVLVSGNTYRYLISSGEFVPGNVSVNFAAGTFASSDGTLNVARTQTFTLADQSVTIELDESDARRIGRWQHSSSISGFVGARYLYTSAGSNASITYTPTLPSDGRYEVFVNYTSDVRTRAGNASYAITTAGGSQTVVISQKEGGGEFRSLGVFEFNEGTSGSVTLDASAADGVVVADGLRFVRVGDLPASADILLDNTDAVLISNWNLSTSVNGFLGDDYLTDRAFGSGRLIYTPNLPSDGEYEVFVNYVSARGRATNAGYEITSQNGKSLIRVDQTVGGGTFQSLGTFNFLAGTSGSVTLRSFDADGVVIGDAVLFRRVGNLTGTPTATLASPAGGTTAVASTINGRSFIDVTFTTTSGSVINLSSITDAAAEFTLSGPGAANVTIDNANVTQLDASTFRYPTIGNFLPGNVDVLFAEETFSDAAGNLNIETFDSFVVTEDVEAEVIVDNTDSGFSVVDPNGDFFSTTSVFGFIGGDYLAARPGSTATATWTPTLTQAGQYEVFVRFTPSTLRASNATYVVTHDGGSTTVIVDQRQGGGGWVSLGSFNLTGGVASVQLQTAGVDNFVIADAVRLVMYP